MEFYLPSDIAMSKTLARGFIDPNKTSEYTSPIRALALFDARPGWDPLKTALHSDLRPRDGRAAAGAFVRASLGSGDGDRHREVVQRD